MKCRRQAWDYLTFVTIFLALAAVVAFWVWLAGLPGRIAIARKHPEAEAVKLLGWGRPAADDLPLGAGVHLGPDHSAVRPLSGLQFPQAE